MEHKISNLVLELLTESRRSDLPYTEKKTKGAIDKVVVNLQGHESGKFTKLAARFKELRLKTDELSAATDALNKDIKEEAIALFDATDEVYTRIVETVSLTILIGKRQPDKMEKETKINYEQIIKDITALVPELSSKIDDIITANTEVTEKLKVAKAPQLRVDMKVDESQALDEAFSFAPFIKVAVAIGRKLLSGIKPWSREYSKKVASIKTRIEQL